MKREEEYCDVCGKLISHYRDRTSHGKEVFGVTTKVYQVAGSFTDDNRIKNPSIYLDNNIKTDCGSRSYATQFYPGSYCSEQCFLKHFTKSVNEFLDRGDSGLKLQVISSK